jgi:hypothetical protein
MPDPIRRELAILRFYGLVTTILLAVFSLSAFRQASQRARFDEIDVQRINVVEPDGRYRMVISNQARSIGPIAYGKPFGYPGGTRPGIIFFNDEGTENGGLTFGGKTENGRYESGVHLSFDQYNQDQVVVLDYQDQNDTKRTGLTFADRAPVPITELVTQLDSAKQLPEGPSREAAIAQIMAPRNGVPLYAERVYVGRNRAKAAVLRLSDLQGKERIRLQVDSLGTASLEFLDASGKVVSRYPTRP